MAGEFLVSCFVLFITVKGYVLVENFWKWLAFGEAKSRLCECLGEQTEGEGRKEGREGPEDFRSFQKGVQGPERNWASLVLCHHDAILTELSDRDRYDMGAATVVPKGNGCAYFILLLCSVE